MPEHAKHAISRGEDRAEVRLHRFGRLRTAAVPLPATSWRPEAWLRAASDGSRGVWRGEGGWAVHGGVLLRLVSDGEDRFRRIRDLAEGPAGLDAAPAVEPDPGSGDSAGDGAGAPVPRFYGGFSYGSAEADLWTSFGAAHFVLPAWEIRRSGGRTLLLVHVLPAADGRGDGAGAGPGDESIRRRALRLREQFLEAGGGDGEGTPRDVAIQPPAPVEERARWESHVEAALEEIAAGRLRKVVLARSVVMPSELTPIQALAALRSHMPGPGTFLVQPDPKAAFVGSSPELLADVRGARFTATAVAGSADRHPEPAADRTRAEALLESGKDRREQAIVAEEIRERLSALATAVRVSDPEILRLPDILHLESRIEARLPGRRHVLEILSRIHPTPAVCGRPRPHAQAFLREHEEMDRGWYAGPVGWFDGRGDGSFSPGLRSGLWSGDRWRIFAGAGIVTGSRPAREWRETELKLEAIRRGFGLAGS